MSVVLDHTPRLLAKWKTGPDASSLMAVLGEAPEAIRLERVHFPSKRPVQLVFVARMRTGLELPILAEHCPRNAEHHATRITASLKKSRNGQRAALATAPVVADHSASLVLRRPGLDERLPGLSVLHDPAFARKVVADLTGCEPGPVTTRLMAHRMGKRAVIRIQGRTGQFFARVRAIKSNEGETRLARHRAVWEALEPGAPFAIPEPLGAQADIGLSLFGMLPGRPPDFTRDHEAVARSISALRSLPLDGLPVHAGADEAHLLREWLDRCRTRIPEIAAAVAPLVARTCDALVAATGTALPCHRDLHEKQILVQGGQAGFLDFDTLSLANPALDPGNLLAHLFFAGIDEAPLRQAIGDTDITLWRRAALLRLAMIYAFTSTPDTAIRRLIDEAAR